MGIIVVDSSALITLARAGALNLLASPAHRVFTVKEVYGEVVTAGLAHGFGDAGVIERAFETELVSVAAPGHVEALPGISLTDAAVLALGRALSARHVLTDDQALHRKARGMGLPGCFTGTYVWMLQANGAITAARRDQLLHAFVAQGRYSLEFMQSLPKGG